MKFNNKRGQAAMEFLMTYGWAILAAVIAIGVLASFGVFNPGGTLPTVCIIGAPLGCDQNQIAADAAADKVSFVLRNAGGSVIDIAADGVSLSGDCVGTNSVAVVDIADGATNNIEVFCATDTVDSGDTLKGDISITYTVTGGSLALTAAGTYTVNVP